MTLKSEIQILNLFRIPKSFSKHCEFFNSMAGRRQKNLKFAMKQ